MITKERQGEIALELIRARFRRRGVPTLSRKKFDEDLEELVEETGLKKRELKEFLEIIIKELWRDVFA
jgi:hypothetical protein